MSSSSSFHAHAQPAPPVSRIWETVQDASSCLLTKLAGDEIRSFAMNAVVDGEDEIVWLTGSVAAVRMLRRDTDRRGALTFFMKDGTRACLSGYLIVVDDGNEQGRSERKVISPNGFVAMPLGFRPTSGEVYAAESTMKLPGFDLVTSRDGTLRFGRETKVSFT